MKFNYIFKINKMIVLIYLPKKILSINNSYYFDLCVYSNLIMYIIRK